MRLPSEVQRLLIMWANTENAEARKDVGWYRVAAGFQDYRPDTAYRENVNHVEWSSEEALAIDKIVETMGIIALYDRIGYQVVRKYWQSNQSINSVIKADLGVGRNKIKEKLARAHNAILVKLGVNREK